jgi:hypothetical protein
MDMTKVNKYVEVTSFYFAKGRNFKSFPARITLENQQFTFKSGLQMLVHRGEEVVRLFSMTDGLTNYRLRQENDQWTLIGFEPAL